MKFDHLKNISYVDSSNLWALDFHFDHPDSPINITSKTAFEIYFSENTPAKKVQAEELLIKAIENFDTYTDKNRYSHAQIKPVTLIDGILKAKVISEKTALQAIRLLPSSLAQVDDSTLLNIYKKLFNHLKTNNIFMTALHCMPLDKLSSTNRDEISRHIIITAIKNGILNQSEIIKLVDEISKQVSTNLTENIYSKLFGYTFKLNTANGLQIIHSAIESKNYDYKLLNESIHTLVTSPSINNFRNGMQNTRTYAIFLMECVITELCLREQENNHSESLILNQLTSVIESSIIPQCGVGSIFSESAHAFDCKISIMKINAADRNDINYEQYITRLLRRMKEPYGKHPAVSEQVHPITLMPMVEEHLVRNTNIKFPIKFVSMFSLQNQLHLVESNRIKESRADYINLTKDRLLKSKPGSNLLVQFDQLCFDELKSQGKYSDIIYTLTNLISSIKTNPFSAKTIELGHSLLEREEISSNKKTKSTWQIFLDDINIITIATAHDAPMDLSDSTKQGIAKRSERTQKNVLHTNLYSFGSDEIKEKISKYHLNEILSHNTPRTGSTIASAVSFLIYDNPTAYGLLEQAHVQELIDSNFTREAGIIIAVRSLLPFLDEGYTANLKNVSQEAALGVIRSLADHAMMSEVEKGHYGVIATFLKKFLATTSINFMDSNYQGFNKWMSLNAAPIYEGAIAEKLQSKLEQQAKSAIHATKRIMI
ncbi:TPA: hypothetical protein RQN23_002919 [Aeromonas veronii]|nr:hypothetical protein [Aeromonas veronii]